MKHLDNWFSVHRGSAVHVFGPLLCCRCDHVVEGPQGLQHRTGPNSRTGQDTGMNGDAVGVGLKKNPVFRATRPYLSEPADPVFFSLGSLKLRF